MKKTPEHLRRFKTDKGLLRESGAKEVLKLVAKGVTYQKIAQTLDVSIGTVYNIANGRTWGHLQENLA